MRLLGHEIERRVSRYWLGRVFANTASLALGVRIFDTQCGAKLFRVTPLTHALFARQFTTRWIFDVEIFARMGQASRVPLAERIYEYPLDAWRDVAGGSVKPRDFVKALLEMVKICWIYYRPGVESPIEATSPTDAAPTAGAKDASHTDKQQAA